LFHPKLQLKIGFFANPFSFDKSLEGVYYVQNYGYTGWRPATRRFYPENRVVIGFALLNRLCLTIRQFLEFCLELE